MLPIVVPVIVLVGLQLLHNWAHPMPGLPSPVIGTWSPTNAWQSQFDGPDGHRGYERPMAYFFFVRPLLSLGVLEWRWIFRVNIPLLLPFVALGVAALAKARAAAPACLLLGWWLLFAGFYSGNVYQADRFVLSYLPPLAVLAGLGFWILDFGFWKDSEQSKIQNPKSKIRLVVIIAAAGLCLAGLVALGSSARADFRGVYQGKEDYLQAVRCVQSVAGVSTGKPVFSFGVSFALREYTGLEPRDLYYETPDSVDAALGGQQTGVRGYLVLPVRGFEEQWGNTPMGATYRHIREAYTLGEHGCEGSSFSVFVVR
jgi:hypothetical protein